MVAQAEAEEANPEEPGVPGSSLPRLDQLGDNSLLIVRFTLNMVAKGTHYSHHPKIHGEIPLY